MQHNRFRAYLKPVCIGNSLVKSLSIPAALVTAQLLSMVIRFATAGEVTAVIQYSLILLGLVLLCTALRTYGDILIKRRQAKAANACRLDFIKRFLNSPLHGLFRANYGELLENFNNDIDTLPSGTSSCIRVSCPAGWGLSGIPFSSWFKARWRRFRCCR